MVNCSIIVCVSGNCWCTANHGSRHQAQCPLLLFPLDDYSNVVMKKGEQVRRVYNTRPLDTLICRLALTTTLSPTSHAAPTVPPLSEDSSQSPRLDSNINDGNEKSVISETDYIEADFSVEYFHRMEVGCIQCKLQYTPPDIIAIWATAYNNNVPRSAKLHVTTYPLYLLKSSYTSPFTVTSHILPFAIWTTFWNHITMVTWCDVAGARAWWWHDTLYLCSFLHTLQTSSYVHPTHTLLETWSDDHTTNWCELTATVSTPDSSVTVTPCYMVWLTLLQWCDCHPLNGVLATPKQVWHTHWDESCISTSISVSCNVPYSEWVL